MRRCFVLVMVCVLLGCPTEIEQTPADLVLTGGTVITLEGEPQEAIAINGPYITAVGSEAEIAAFIGSDTRVINLAGKTAIPGLIEGHGHFLSLGQSKLILDLNKAKNFGEIVNQVAAAVDTAEPGAWILGRGWHQDKWDQLEPDAVEGVPVNTALNAVSPDNPVLLGHASGHAAYANDAALAAAGIDAKTADPAGGTIVRNANGKATGLLRETAQRLVQSAHGSYESQMPQEHREQRFRQQVYLAGKEALSLGITSFHDAGSSFQVIDQLRTMEEEQALPIRLYVMIKEPNTTLQSGLAKYLMPLEGNDFLTVRSIKKQIDGALGAHGAWLLEPYTDLAKTRGLVLESVNDIEATATLALEHGFQLATHAIGTRGNRETLDLYERSWGAHAVEGSDLRWRIEHAQHIHPTDIPRFAELGVIAAIQGVHCTSDGPWIPIRLGLLRTQATSYRWRDLIDAGVRINNGTDAPVEALDPFASIYASVARVMANGEAFHPAQAMTREEALRSYTIDNAYSAFEEAVKGSLAPGKLADIAVLSANILTIPDKEISDLEVHYTVVGGEVRYERDLTL